MRKVFDAQLAALANAAIDISATAKPRHHRLIDCSRCVEHQSLRIYELNGSISTVDYAAISYVWRGNTFDETANQSDRGAFAIKGAEDGDPVGLDVLYHICTSSLKEGVQYLWLDRLCIMQTNKEDKAWQIEQMYSIYKSCRACLVLPGGIRQLVTEEEETSWIERAWTLQEVMAPERVLVLLKWGRGSGSWQGYNGAVKATVTDVIPKQSAVVLLRELLEACSYPEALTWTPSDGSEERDDISAEIMGGSSDVSNMLTESLSHCIDEICPQGKAHAIWQNVFWRTSSRPVDMVLSIMGIFGVTLNPRVFDKNDRVGATIALAKEILRKGGKPTWLVMAFNIPPCRFLSSFPEFPSTRVTGEVDFPTATADQQFDLTLWWVDDLPNGSMDDDGYVTITSKAAPVSDTGKSIESNFAAMQNDNLESDASCVPVTARDGKVWNILKHPAKCHDTVVVFLGHAQEYPRADTSATNSGPFELPHLSPLRAIILETHAPGKFHRIGALTLGEIFESLIENNWQERTFAIGGPDTLPSGTFRGYGVAHS